MFDSEHALDLTGPWFSNAIPNHETNIVFQSIESIYNLLEPIQSQTIPNIRKDILYIYIFINILVMLRLDL